jgi:hypothetical protein
LLVSDRMKQRQKFELLIGDMRRLIEASESAEDGIVLTECSWGLGRFIEELTRDPVKVGMLLEVAVRLRESDVRGRQMAEERILNLLTALAGMCQPKPGSETGLGDSFQPEMAGGSVPDECVTIRTGLHEFALGCFAFKRSRDAFGGRRRRAAAFEILGEVGLAWDSAEVEALAVKAILSGRSAEARAALDFMVNRVFVMGAEPDDSLIAATRRMIERGDTESNVFAGLNALVEWFVISELEAMDRLDEWRAERCRG